MKLIQLPIQAFEERLKQEIEENPALDTGKESGSTEDDLGNDYEYDDDGNDTIDADDINIDEYLSDDEIPNYKTQANNYSSDDEDKHTPYAAGTTFHQYLKNQLNTFRIDEEERIIAEFLVGSIDDSGYIRRELLDLVDDLAFTQNAFTTEEKVSFVLTEVVHALDPIGVGARDLKECLIIQLKAKEETAIRKLSIAILEQAFDHFVKKHYTKLTEKFAITEEQLKEVTEQQQRLNSVLSNIGVLEVQKQNLAQQVKDISEEIEKTKSELEEEYGKVNINLSDGTYEEIEEKEDA